MNLFSFFLRSCHGLHALAVLLPLCLGSCVGARVKSGVTFRDPAFVQGALKGKTVAVTGVLVGPHITPPNRVQEAMILEDLEAQLKASPALGSVIGGKFFEQKVGKVWDRALWQKSGNLKLALTPAQKARVQSLGIHYFLVVTLPVNNTQERIDRHTFTHTNTTYDEKGNVETCDSTTTYTTQSMSFRRLVACHHLYDVATGLNVWRTYGEHVLYRMSERSSTSGYPEAPPFPAPPGESEVVKAISEKVLKLLK
ncbi:hypothetical protein [Prosthecobacter dejongeii]|uniref:Lipoprotein n=1 Tax=Prosthecobacter dejongeii TaxID=48465 RepID=A0A7W7YKS3_9BACT|nr:hypothetical protein [Prosthecobacter dejongeii]MBB5038048.1 hypothetical protein [Prosthecobacter dejongeii]